MNLNKIKKKCKRMISDDVSQENIISYLYDEDVSIFESIVLIRELYDISLGEAKQIVSTSPCWKAFSTVMDKEHEKLIEEVAKDKAVISIKNMTKNIISGRDISLQKLVLFDDFDFTMKNDGKFGLFLILSKDIEDWNKFDIFMRKLLNSGLVYIDFWGKSCEDACNKIDEIIIEINPNETSDNVIMTKEYSNEDYKEAMWNFLNVSFPANSYEDDCKDEIVLLYGESGQDEKVIDYLNNQQELYKDVKGFVPDLMN